MPLHDEARRDDVQLLGHVLADLDQFATTLPAAAGLGLVPVLDALQMRGQRWAAGAPFARGWLGLALEWRERLQTRFARGNVGGEGLVEEVLHGRAECLARRCVAQTLELGEFMHDQLVGNLAGVQIRFGALQFLGKCARRLPSRLQRARRCLSPALQLRTKRGRQVRVGEVG